MQIHTQHFNWIFFYKMNDSKENLHQSSQQNCIIEVTHISVRVKLLKVRIY